MTAKCVARKHDRWRTVWECELDEHATGFHVNDGFLWHDQALVPARVAIAQVRYDGTNYEAVRGIVRVTSFPTLEGDFLPVQIVTRADGLTSLAWPGQWVVVHDDDTAQVLDDDRFHENYRLPAGSRSGAGVG